jgi:hypothetical protein
VEQKVFGPDQRDDGWYFYAYVDGQQVEWGPYRSQAFALGAMKSIENRLDGLEAAGFDWSAQTGGKPRKA